MRKEVPVSVIFATSNTHKVQEVQSILQEHPIIIKQLDVKGPEIQSEDIEDIAIKLGIKTVPYLGMKTITEAVIFIRSKPNSIVAKEEMGITDHPMEGIVARTHPLLLMRNGKRLMWKLKVNDFETDTLK